MKKQTTTTKVETRSASSLLSLKAIVALSIVFWLTQLPPFGGIEGGCQDLLYVKGNITVTPSASIYIKGGLNAGDSASITNDGIITIANHTTPGGENWTNNTSDTMLSGSGTVIFSSSEQQNISGNYPTTYAILDINNSSAAGIVLDTNCFVSDTLKLNDGVVHTGDNRITVTATDAGSITDYLQGPVTASYIHGNLRRYIAANTDTFGFPVGTDSIYYLAEIENNNLTGITYIDARFDSLLNHNDIDLNVAESGNQYYTVCDEGVWYLTPDVTVLSGTYNIRAYIGNFNSCSLQDNLFAILKRPDNSITAADWDCSNCGIGVGLNPNGGLGRMVADPYALRKGLSNFSQFGIAKIICNTVALPNDTVICASDSILIYAGDFATYLWSTGSADSAIYVSGGDTCYVDVIDNWDCPSSDTMIVTALPTAISAIDTNICQGDSLFAGGAFQTGSGIYYDTTTASNGCDSIITTNLTVLLTTSSAVDTNICQGDSLFAGGAFQTGSGAYKDTTASANGCDSIITTNLTVLLTASSTIDTNICPGDSLFAGGAYQTVSGTYYDITTASNGCDSIITTNLTVLLTASSAIDTNICQGDSIQLPGGTWVNTEGLYYDTITSVAGCDSVITTTLTVSPPPIAGIAGTTTICNGDSTVLNTTGGPIFLWDTGDNTQSIIINPTDNTTYFVTVTNSCGSSTDSIEVTVYPLPTAYAGTDTTIIAGSSVQLLGLGGTIYLWEPPEGLSCTDCQGPVASPTETTTYYLTVTDKNGCSATDDITIYIDYSYSIFVPNIFSPNGDNQNDILYVKGNGIKSIHFFIYDRWGEKVFETVSTDIGWDGTYKGRQMNSAVFVYYLEASYINGSEIIEKGNITLIR